MKDNKFATIKIRNKNIKIAVIQARFNQKITDSLNLGAIKALKESGIKQENIDIYQVPGSFEIPIKCLSLAMQKKYTGIVVVGAIIKGETPHFDYVAKAVTDGVLKVMLEENIIITFGIITANNLKQAKNRSGDESNKGYEAGMSLIEMLQND